MPRKLRAAAQAAAKSMKNAPQLPEISDEEMGDAPASQPSSPVIDPPSPENDPDVDPEVDDEDEEAQSGTPVDTKGDEAGSAETPAAEDASVLEEAGTPAFSGGRQSAIPRKRRIGRPPKNRPPDWDAPDGPDTPIRVTTPVKRRRGRPAASGGRWSRGRGGAQNTQIPVDKEGNLMDVVNDEVSLPPNPVGDTKVDENGHLQGGREYRVRTFTILNRGDRLYMLSTEPARCIGFRDSYLFFQKHKMLYKIIIDDDAKRDLIERDIILSLLQGSCHRCFFREFGAKIVVAGKKILDDYDEDAARERGDVEGELAVPEDKLPGPGEEYNRNQYVAWHGASSVYHTNAPRCLWLVESPLIPKSDVFPSPMTIGCLSMPVQQGYAFNSKLAELRKATMNGTYDVHTNAIHYPRIMQPTHVRYERVSPPDSRSTAELMDDMSSLSIGSKGPHFTQVDPTSQSQNAARPNNEPSTPNETTEEQAGNIFPPVPISVSSKYTSSTNLPPYSNMGLPGPDGDLRSLGPNGLVSIANPRHVEFMNPEIIAMLPEDCKEALLDAAANEVEWKSRWSTESEDCARSRPLKSYAWFS
ncbi:Chromatin structure-remodeling complex subunit rsc7 [Penicillium chermesinum]|uniref:Chromatin structure-remodeling complex subunit rsc7 n=1 Tax=Penicillium chermesinum TaxID=63820 RepID=A0A9W9N8C3_9EURO|nr:Chromatin structure-remodeling complex subunit rsc7 [Penicillium chermesinum]KAJ5215081.1 Chromatin structure-remodeling complex subunit rsc7 [Penicillium chermesinum]